MGLRLFTCRGGYSPNAPAPNPNPSRWQILDIQQFHHGYVLTVKYLDCTNFEGVKVMVYRGKYEPRESLDPHFSEDDDSPIARFRPDAEGKAMAFNLAMSLLGVIKRRPTPPADPAVDESLVSANHVDNGDLAAERNRLRRDELEQRVADGLGQLPTDLHDLPLSTYYGGPPSIRDKARADTTVTPAAFDGPRNYEQETAPE